MSLVNECIPSCSVSMSRSRVNFDIYNQLFMLDLVKGVLLCFQQFCSYILIPRFKSYLTLCFILPATVLSFIPQQIIFDSAFNSFKVISSGALLFLCVTFELSKIDYSNKYKKHEVCIACREEAGIGSGFQNWLNLLMLWSVLLYFYMLDDNWPLCTKVVFMMTFPLAKEYFYKSWVKIKCTINFAISNFPYIYLIPRT